MVCVQHGLECHGWQSGNNMMAKIVSMEIHRNRKGNDWNKKMNSKCEDAKKWISRDFGVLPGIKWNINGKNIEMSLHLGKLVVEWVTDASLDPVIIFDGLYHELKNTLLDRAML